MSLIKCPTCKAEISYNYDNCPNCGGNVYEEPSEDIDTYYEDDYKDFVSTTKRTKWYHAAILFIASLAMILAIMWGAGDVIEQRAINSAPEESYILFVAGLGLFIFTKVLIHSDKRREEF